MLRNTNSPAARRGFAFDPVVASGGDTSRVAVYGRLKAATLDASLLSSGLAVRGGRGQRDRVYVHAHHHRGRAARYWAGVYLKLAGAPFAAGNNTYARTAIRADGATRPAPKSPAAAGPGC
ncbi:hypothetical protein ACI78T_06590 [Blastococcus sp. SYSU D00922]